jgi:hypothetical protein
MLRTLRFTKPACCYYTTPPIHAAKSRRLIGGHDIYQAASDGTADYRRLGSRAATHWAHLVSLRSVNGELSLATWNTGDWI